MSIHGVIAVVGLGYVGLPLAVEFGKRRATIGFDLDEEKIDAFCGGHDPTGEISDEDFGKATQLECTTDSSRLSEANLILVAVPTPVDESHNPDLSHLVASSEIVGRAMREGTTVIYESTVYPGATEEICIPILEKVSGLTWKKDFFVGYSPERINPGDRQHTLRNVVKVVAGDSPETECRLVDLYGEIVEAGTHLAPSIAVAEAAKVIENTQRDLNIALMNELAILFHRLNLDTSDVLEVAGTKWNFLPFRPGLVGGHCIGVDPYYLTYKAEQEGYRSQVILAGRRINDGMGEYIARQTVKGLVQQGRALKGSRVVVLGFSFKEDCSDVRNTQVAHLVRELGEFGCEVWVHDPVASPREAKRQCAVVLSSWQGLPAEADAVVLAVAHRKYLQMGVPQLLACLQPGALVVDVKAALEREELLQRGLTVWRL